MSYVIEINILFALVLLFLILLFLVLVEIWFAFTTKNEYPSCKNQIDLERVKSWWLIKKLPIVNSKKFTFKNIIVSNTDWAYN